MMKNWNTIIYSVSFVAILLCCGTPYSIAIKLKQPIVGCASLKVGHILEDVSDPMSFTPDLTWEEKSILKTEIEQNIDKLETFSVIDEGESDYNVDILITVFNRGEVGNDITVTSGDFFVRAPVCYSGLLIAYIKLIDNSTGKVVFAGDFKGESEYPPDAIYGKVAKGFRKALEKELKKHGQR